MQKRRPPCPPTASPIVMPIQLFDGDEDAAADAVESLRKGERCQIENADGTISTIENTNGPMGYGEVNIALGLAEKIVEGGDAETWEDALYGSADTTGSDGKVVEGTAGVLQCAPTAWAGARSPSNSASSSAGGRQGADARQRRRRSRRRRRRQHDSIFDFRFGCGRNEDVHAFCQSCHSIPRGVFRHDNRRRRGMFVGHDFGRHGCARSRIKNDSSQLPSARDSAFVFPRSEGEAWIVRQDCVDADENRVSALP